MKTINITIISLLLLVFSCTSKTPKKEQSSDSTISVSVADSVKDNVPQAPLLSSEILGKQSFKVNNNKIVKLTSKGGVKITINKNTFVDSEGNTVDGDIEIEYKEALNPTDIVLGNLTTTYYGMYLESGGMFYTNALANGKQLKIANGKSLAFEVPTTSYKDDMMIFNSEQKNAEIQWQNPDAMDEQKAALAFVRLEPPVYRYHIWHTNGYWIGSLPFSTTQQITKSIKKTLREHPLTTDTIIKVWHYDITVMRLLDSNAKPIVRRAFNTHRVDEKTSYLFTTNNLGWANIDRLYKDPRTKNVEFITKIDKPNDFDNVYISILFPKQNMYIPGYQKKDGTFSFTHGDYEEPKFPIGETAIVLATAYKNNVPHYALKKLVIAKEQIVSLQLKETTKEALKIRLKAEI